MRRLAERLGRRGAFLAIFGVSFLVIGLKSIVEPSVDDGRFVLYALLPSVVRAFIWGVPAILAIVAAFRPAARDGFGFAALTVPTIVVSFSYIWSFVAFLAGATDWPFGWSSATTWTLLLTLILIVSGWAEVRHPRTPRKRHRRGQVS